MLEYKEANGTFYHIQGACKKPRNFWKDIHAEKQKFLKINFTMKLQTVLPNNTEQTSQALFGYMFTAAKVITATKWKAEECPACEIWKDKMANHVVTTKLTN